MLGKQRRAEHGSNPVPGTAHAAGTGEREEPEVVMHGTKNTWAMYTEREQFLGLLMSVHIFMYIGILLVK